MRYCTAEEKIYNVSARAHARTYTLSLIISYHVGVIFLIVLKQYQFSHTHILMNLCFHRANPVLFFISFGINVSITRSQPIRWANNDEMTRQKKLKLWNIYFLLFFTLLLAPQSIIRFYIFSILFVSLFFGLKFLFSYITFFFIYFKYIDIVLWMCI